MMQERHSNLCVTMITSRHAFYVIETSFCTRFTHDKRQLTTHSFRETHSLQNDVEDHMMCDP